jgi:hypothetical protein
MAAVPHRQDPEITAELELRALERMIAARCEQIGRLAREARSRGDLSSREADLQLEVFAERRTLALRQLQTDSGEPLETRAARLESLLEALECSWEYFCPKDADSSSPEGVRQWAVLVR